MNEKFCILHEAAGAQTGALAKLALLRNWRTGETGALAKLALWQNWRSGDGGNHSQERTSFWRMVFMVGR